jgi:hypothetical protein
MSSENAEPPAISAADNEAKATAPIIKLDEDVTSDSPSIPPLFKPTKICVKKYWEIISLVAPYVDESKEWKTREAVKAYCMKYNVLMPWTIQNPKQVQRHMTKYLVDFLAKKRKETAATANDNQYSFDNEIGP